MEDEKKPGFFSFLDTKCVYTGKLPECEVTGLQPNTNYVFKVRAYTEGDESPFSDIVAITTEESGKSDKMII